MKYPLTTVDIYDGSKHGVGEKRLLQAERLRFGLLVRYRGHSVLRRGNVAGRRRMKVDWQQVKFGDVVRQVKDKVDAKSSDLTRAMLLGSTWKPTTSEFVVGARSVTTIQGRRFTCASRQVMFTVRGEIYLRKVAVPHFEGRRQHDVCFGVKGIPMYCCRNCCRSSCRRKRFTSIRSSNRKAPSIHTSTSLISQLQSTALPPLEEQRRIAEMLWRHRRYTIQSETWPNPQKFNIWSLLLHLFEKRIDRAEKRHLSTSAFRSTGLYAESTPVSICNLSNPFAAARNGPNQRRKF